MAQDQDVSEKARLDALYQFELLDTPPSEAFDRITRMAGRLFGLPIAAVSLTDRDRQWFKSRVGVEHWSIPRNKAPCSEVAETTDSVLIPDLLADECYADSNLARQGVRFYAGAPLVTRDGYGLGALCVLGVEPREASEPEMAALRDLAEMVMDQVELQHALGRIDPTSGLPNRTQFLDDLEDLGRDRPGEDRLLVLVDLARVDQVSNGVRVLGSSFVDRMIGDAARSIRAALGTRGKAYHVAPTQFAFVALPGDETAACVSTLGEAVEGSRTGSNIHFGMTTTIGLVPFVTGCGAADVLRRAYSAADDAREAGVRAASYSRSSDDQHRRRFKLLNDFEVALATPDQLRLVYQPRVCLQSGRCVGAEALLRWRHPELGEIPAAEFIPIIEQTSLARTTGTWVLDTALRQLQAWQLAGLDLDLSVNIAAASFDDADFSARVQLLLMKHRVRPERLELEVTESIVIGNAQQAIRHLQALVDSGVRVAIDDFGTGYSGLSYLQQLPATVIKIDQSFIRQLDSGDRTETLVRGMIGLAHELGHRVVAEGVETAAATSALLAMGCDEAQGHFFARAMEIERFEDWLHAGTRESDRNSAAA